MLLFHCPFCGPRDQSEFTYGREVAPVPALDASRAEWERYVFERENPRGAHREWWHHNLGCRQWLVVTRDTLTHAVIDVSEPGSRERTEPGSKRSFEPGSGPRKSESGSALRAEPDSDRAEPDSDHPR